MRLDHLLSRDLGACGGRGARAGASPGPLVARRGAGRAGAREHAPLLVGWGVPVLPLVGGWGHAVGVWGCVPFVSCFCFSPGCLLLPVVVVVWGGCGGVGGLVVNCIVDASIFVLCGVFLLCASRPGPAAVVVGSGAWFLPVLCVVFMGVRWMPWHQGPMKDVVDCDKPRGAVLRALIRGFPNGGTRRPSRGVTRV